MVLDGLQGAAAQATWCRAAHESSRSAGAHTSTPVRCKTVSKESQPGNPTSVVTSLPWAQWWGHWTLSFKALVKEF